MKRFTLWMVVLFVMLALARAAQGAMIVHPDHDEDAGPTTERAAFFDHRVRPERSVHRPGLRTGTDAPQRRGEAIRFRYRDRGYTQVYLAGEVVGDEPLRMDYDPGTDRWETHVALEPGTYLYHFEVEDEDGHRRDRVDPANPRRRRDDDRWVSELRVDRRGEVELALRETRHSRRTHDDYDLDLLDELGLDYQRVDGLMLSSRPRFATREPFAPTVEAFVGYGFSSDDWSLQANFLQPLSRSGRLRLVVSAYDRTDFTDRTGVGDFENSVSTLVFREDSRDWFRREGISAGVEADFESWLLARVEMRSDTYRSAPRRVKAGWGGREDFLPNPEIDEGLMRSLFARVRLGNDLTHLWLEFEHADDALLSTQFEFTQLTAQYRTRMQLGHAQHLDLRVRFGTAIDGALPRQKRYLAGGIGTVRGTRYQSLLEGAENVADSYGGERMLVANAEYVMGSRSDLSLACFLDTGNVWADRDADVFDSELRTSIGLGLMLNDGDGGLRVDLIKPLEGSGDPMVQARLRRPF